MDIAGLKREEFAAAERLLDAVRAVGDPRMPYADVRPVTDVKHMLETSVELYGERTAFFVKDSPGAPYREVSYRRLKEDVDALGTALVARGLKGKRVAVIGENSYQWAVSYLAVTCGTGVVVPLDRELPEEDIETLLLESGAEGALFSGKHRKMFLSIAARGRTALRVLADLSSGSDGDGALAFAGLLDEGAGLLRQGRRDFLDARAPWDELCALLFTSGTTGVAKGVMLSHRNLATGMMLPPMALNITKEDVFFSVLPLHHCYECTCGFLIPLYRGAAIAHCEGLKQMLKNLSEARPTVMLAVPLIVESLYRRVWQTARKSGKERLLRALSAASGALSRVGANVGRLFFKQIHELFGGRMRVIICGGAAIDPDVLRGIRRFGILAVQGYGLTECSPICALNPDAFVKDASAGYVLTGMEGKVHEPDTESGVGEICVKGGHVMMGYYNNPEATAEVLRDGWFYTGDLGYIDKDGYVFITGRRKNVIITKNGKNVFPEELEYKLSQLEEVAACMVWGQSGENGETAIVATIQPDEEVLARVLGEGATDEQATELLWRRVDEVNKRLPLFKMIRRIVLRRKDFDMTTGKKIKRFMEGNKGQ
ncbi:MAG: AMP-binding protein [Clostridiales Family XIII bacterium]|nr:AMP-binding protein [Clostridiales Family XIII bacterium]